MSGRLAVSWWGVRVPSIKVPGWRAGRVSTGSMSERLAVSWRGVRLPSIKVPGWRAGRVSTGSKSGRPPVRYLDEEQVGYPLVVRVEDQLWAGGGSHPRVGVLRIPLREGERRAAVRQTLISWTKELGRHQSLNVVFTGNFCFGWWSNFVGSEPGHKQSVKLLQKMSTTQLNTPSPPSPHSHTLSIYCTLTLGRGEGGGC
jgi:hypothetical protein